MHFFWPTALITIGLILYILALRKKHVQEKDDLKKQLEEEIKEKQQILSIVSHDIKSPFNRISAFEQLITMDTHELSPDQRSYLIKIHQVVADGLGLIRNLVDYRNLEYRKFEIIPERVNVSSLVQTTVKRHLSLAEAKNIQFDLDIQEEVYVTSDNHLISRAVGNLLSNAIKFSNEGKKIGVNVYHNKGLAIIEINDHGPGFSDEEKHSLFKKFQKLSAKSTAGESTTGLGLYNTKAMLQHIGGTIECYSKYKEGSTFIVSIPSFEKD